jgi:hypothetical protein
MQKPGKLGEEKKAGKTSNARQAMLRAIGVNFAQGYGIGKPQPFENLLKRHSNKFTWHLI